MTEAQIKKYIKDNFFHLPRASIESLLFVIELKNEEVNEFLTGKLTYKTREAFYNKLDEVLI